MPFKSNKEGNEDKRDHLPPPSPLVSLSENSCLFKIFLNKNSHLKSQFFCQFRYKMFEPCNDMKNGPSFVCLSGK